METEQGKEKGKMEKEARLTWKKNRPKGKQFVIQTKIGEGVWETNPTWTDFLNDQGMLVPGQAEDIIGRNGAFLSGRIVQNKTNKGIVTAFETSKEK